MKATVLLAGLPSAELRVVTPHLQGLGACVLQARGVERALEHLSGGAVDALVLDAGLLKGEEPQLAPLLRETRRRGTLLIGVGAWPETDGLRLAARLDKPLQPAALARLLSSRFG